MSTDAFIFHGDNKAADDDHGGWIDILSIPLPRPLPTRYEPMDKITTDPVELEMAGDLNCLPNGVCWEVEDGEACRRR